MSPEKLENLEFLVRNLDIPVPDQINLKDSAKPYIGWGLVFVLLNPKGEILLLTEKRNSEHSRNKAGLLSVIYETGKHESIRSAMIGGIGGEIGDESVGKCHYDPDKFAEYDFHKVPGDKASRSIIVVGYYDTDRLPILLDDQLEATAVRWTSPEEVLALDPSKLRENLPEIIQILNNKGWLNTENTRKMPILNKPLNIPEFLKERDIKPDLRYI